MPSGIIGDNVLDTSLAICTMLNFNYLGPELEPAIGFLLNEQKKNGSWAKRGFYYDGPKKLVSWGSEELTTSFCLEAIWRYRALST